MLMISVISSLIMSLILLYVLYFRSKALMKFFQQEEYDNARFLKWFKQSKAYDKGASAVLLISFAGVLFTEYAHIASGVTLLGLIIAHILSRRAIENSKKPLVNTDRVKRITRVYILINIFILLSIYVVSNNFLTNFALEAFILLQSTPLLMVLSNKLLEPSENRVRAAFKAEADAKFAKLSPRVIGITGSFGKTSTKHILNHILSTAQPTLATPGSVNTIMGITRVIREQLKPDHHFFIVEMGAYGPGSIASLAAFTPPEVGLITAVGAAHYERFKSLETVARAKFELAENVFSHGGTMIVNSDGIDKTLLEDRIKSVPGPYKIVGEGQPFHLISVRMDEAGTHIELMDDDGTPQKLLIPLYGMHQAENTLLAVATARALGLPWSVIRGAMRNMPQIKHRVEVTKTEGQPIIINDAYNSNPIGFAAALDVLDILKRKGKRYLLTPGMVELGATHEQEHEKLGTLAAQKADIILAVTPDRIPSFVAAAKAEKAADVHCFDTQEAAQTWLNAHITADDVVLFENNLPDLYEAKISF